ncbi:unnamed protein product [Urochloa decumbens]|uniref:BLE2 protein n=1 Tax=Urochloa decumbens TaxID=240449 RepID=A0ABC9BTE7_9POAL
MASATPAASAGEVAVLISAAAACAVAAGGDGESQERERRLNRFVRVVAFGEWAGNAFGALAFLWATVVLLGGFCSVLKPVDFWFATVIIFIEAFRIFSRNYKLENQALFGTTRALRWINVPFVRMLGRPQEGNEVVLIMGLWIDLVNWLPVVGPMFMGILQAALLILMSKKMELRGTCQLTSRSRRCRRLQLWAVLIAFLIIYTLFLSGAPSAFENACASTEILTQVVAALLLIFRPQVVVNLTNTPWCRRLLSLSKVISAVSLAFGFAVALWPPALAVSGRAVDPSSFIRAFTVAVLSLGSLQTPAAANNTLFGGRWIEAIVDILFLWHLLVTLPAALSGGHGDFVRQLTTIAAGISSILVLLMKNLQIPAAALQVLLSSSRFSSLQSEYRQPSPQDCTTANPNLVPAIIGFYVLALCEGSLYILASILGLFSFFPRRSLVRHSKLFHGQRGAKAIDLYYQHAYATCMDTGPFAAKKNLSLAGFATESLMTSSSSSEMQRAAVLVLGNLDSIEELRSRILGTNNRALSTLIGMLGWEDVQHRDIRLIAAGIIANLADSLTISEIPGTLKLVSSLLDADNQPVKDEPAGRQDSMPNVRNAEQLEHGQDDSGGCWVRRRWQQMKKKWSILEEQEPLTHQISLPIQGMVILERLAHDPDNCAEMAKATYLIAKIVGLISYTTADSESSKDNKQQHMMIFSSLNFVRRLAITGESIGVALRQELCKNYSLLNNLECVLEDSHRSPEIMKLVFEILAKLAFDKDARKEIGSSKVTISKLMLAFIGKDGSTNAYYDQSLRMAAGEALANLTIESTANCLAILEEPGFELIKDLKKMFCEDEYRYVVASLLQNVCAHSTDKLRHHQGVGDHLSSAIPMLMENIMSAGGKQLEPLISLVSEISNVIPEPFVYQLQLQANGSELVQKLVGTLNSNRKPNPEYPRMRRVVIEMVISTVKLCPRYATIFREGGMMEALNKVERTPSKVEEYRVFYGNVGVVLESGSPLAALAATAKGLVHSAAPTLGA